jgi:hypothetical protein
LQEWSQREYVADHPCSPRYNFRRSNPKLRKILTTKRVGSVSRKEIAAAVKTVMAERDLETARLVRGEGSLKKAAAALRK